MNKILIEVDDLKHLIEVLPSVTFALSEEGKGLIVNKEQVLNAINSHDITLLDVRDVDEWDR